MQKERNKETGAHKDIMAAGLGSFCQVHFFLSLSSQVVRVNK